MNITKVWSTMVEYGYMGPRALVSLGTIVLVMGCMDTTLPRYSSLVDAQCTELRGVDGGGTSVTPSPDLGVNLHTDQGLDSSSIEGHLGDILDAMSTPIEDSMVFDSVVDVMAPDAVVSDMAVLDSFVDQDIQDAEAPAAVNIAGLATPDAQEAPRYEVVMNLNDGNVETSWTSLFVGATDTRWVSLTFRDFITIKEIDIDWHELYYPHFYQVALEVERIDSDETSWVYINEGQADETNTLIEFVPVGVKSIWVLLLAPEAAYFGINELYVYQ